MGRKRKYNRAQDWRYGEVPIARKTRCKFTNHKINVPVAPDYGTWYRVTDSDIPLVNGIEIYVHPTSDSFPSDLFFALTGSTAQAHAGATFGYRINVGTVASSTKTLMEFIPCSNANQLWYQAVDLSTNATVINQLSFYAY